MRYIPFVFYVASIVGANWLLAHFDPIPVGFGLMAPAGVILAGFAFSFRNLTQLALGRAFGFAAIAVGALLSATVFQSDVKLGGVLPIWAASGVAFAFSETADALVWTKLRERGWWARAMGLGDLAGQVIDSIIFLVLAFGSIDFLLGQIVGKNYTIIPAMLLMTYLARRAERIRNETRKAQEHVVWQAEMDVVMAGIQAHQARRTGTA